MLNVETRRIEASSSVPINRRDSQINFYLNNIRAEEQRRISTLQAEEQENQRQQEAEEHERRRIEQGYISQQRKEDATRFFSDNGLWIGGLVLTGLSLGIGIPMAKSGFQGWPEGDDSKAFWGLMIAIGGSAGGLGLFFAGLIESLY
jgi:hypothetical protein